MSGVDSIFLQVVFSYEAFIFSFFTRYKEVVLRKVLLYGLLIITLLYNFCIKDERSYSMLQ